MFCQYTYYCQYVIIASSFKLNTITTRWFYEWTNRAKNPPDHKRRNQLLWRRMHRYPRHPESRKPPRYTRRIRRNRDGALLDQGGDGGEKASVLWALAIMADFSKEALPFFHDFLAAGFNDGHNITQRPRWDLRIIIAQQAFPCPCNPDFCGVAAGSSLWNMDVNRFQRVVFIRPEIHPIWTDSKNLRHCQIPLLAKIGESGVP